MRDIRPPKRYMKVDLVIYALSLNEDIESSKESSIEAIYSIDSVMGCAFALFGNHR